MSKITFELENKEYELPDHLTIDNYVKVYKVKDFLGEEYFQAKIINAITGVKLESILKTNHATINYLSNYIFSLFPDDDYKFYDRFELDGIKYGFIPSWKDMSFAEFVDLDTLFNKPVNEIIDNFHILCAIMYRPIIEEKGEHNFKIEEYSMVSLEDRAELFRNKLDVKYVLGAQFFFSRFVNQSLNLIQTSSTQKFKDWWMRVKLTWKYRKLIWKSLLNKDLDGSRLLIEFAMMTLQDMTKSSKLPWWKRSINYLTFWKKTKK